RLPVDQGCRIASASGCHRSPAASAENATQRSLGSWQPPRTSFEQWPIAGTAHLRASATPTTEAIAGVTAGAGGQSDADLSQLQGHIAIPVAAFPLRTSRIVPCFETSFLYCSRPGRLPLRKKNRRLRFASDILSPQGWDTLCTIPRDRARQLS